MNIRSQLIGFAIICLISCVAQKNETMVPPIDSSYGSFDIKAYKEAGGGKVLRRDDEKVVEEESQSYGYIRRIYFHESYFTQIEKFFSSGGLMEKVLSFNCGSPVGIWYFYNENGKLTKETDTDQGFEFSSKDVITFCLDRQILLPKGYSNSGFGTRVIKDSENSDNTWVITWRIASDKLQVITLDGSSGEVINTSERSMSPN